MTTVQSTSLRAALASFSGETDEVRKARRSELGGAARALAAAFADDPVFAYSFPDARRRERAIPAYFDLVVGTLWSYDEIYTIGDLDGVAVWVPAGEPLVPHHAEKSFDARLADLAGPDLGTLGEVIGLLEDHHPSQPCAYLRFVGVRPGAQSGALGSALLASALRRYDAEGLPAYTEATTLRNRDLYQRHGFEVMTELTIAGGPSMWPMWREQRSAG